METTNMTNRGPLSAVAENLRQLIRATADVVSKITIVIIPIIAVLGLHVEGVAGAFFGMVYWLLLAVGVTQLAKITNKTSPDTTSGADDGLNHVKQRYVRGEISMLEFESELQEQIADEEQDEE